MDFTHQPATDFSVVTSSPAVSNQLTVNAQSIFHESGIFVGSDCHLLDLLFRNNPIDFQLQDISICIEILHINFGHIYAKSFCLLLD